MAKLNLIAKRRPESKLGKRLYTSVDMSIIKHDAAVKKSRIKRGEIEDNPINLCVVCGWGREGCFLHFGTDLNKNGTNTY
jgi:hypothetical protein